MQVKLSADNAQFATRQDVVEFEQKSLKPEMEKVFKKRIEALKATFVHN